MEHLDDDEWELVNDDGWVYKRRKRPRVGPTTSSAVHPPPDPAVEIRHRIERKKKALLKLRDRYLKEISRWELLSNILKEISENQETRDTTLACEASTSEEPLRVDTNSQSRSVVIDELLGQVEAQEAMIQTASNLCDVAESLCAAEEERLKQQLTELPIWDPSPQELMAALSEQ